MPHELLWVVVVVVAIAVLLLIALTSVMRRRNKPFRTQMFPANYVEPYERRIDEVERMFVNQPREAVAAAKLLVDDMLTRMGYPVRISNDERVRDLRHYSRSHADRYRVATGLKANPTTEDLRRALQAYLDTARDLCGDARKSHHVPAEETRRPEIAG
ncbi:MAG: hypothetical protein E6I08_11430 [Chloroflexi bacterium]|nr:MAG: hypothetical protein E6I08_11430 [Chloroflexota bacterium]